MTKEQTKSKDIVVDDGWVSLKWLVAARLVILSIALLALTVTSVYSDAEAPTRLNSIFSWLAVLFGLCAAGGIWLLYRPVHFIFVWVQLLADTVVVSSVVYFTGGPISPFLFLYLPIVMEAAIFLSRAASLTTAILCGIEYLALIAAIKFRYLQSAEGNYSYAVPSVGIIAQMVGLCSAMVLIAVATSYLSRKLRSSSQLVAQSRRDISELTDRQRMIIAGIPEGIITCDENGRIVEVNPAACALLRIESENYIGKFARDLLIDFRIIDSTEEINVHVNLAPREIEIEVDHDSRDVRFHLRHLSSQAGIGGRFLVVLQDITRLRSVEAQLELQDKMARLLAETGQGMVGQSESSFDSFVGESPVMRKIFALIERVSGSDANVLVYGESGTGKELVARAVHFGGKRKNAPFVAVNCGAIPENLIESQLFGHRKGSFTSAESDHMGLFRQADSGTIFLDEIGELPLQMQSKLLRAIQHKSVRPIGGERDIPIDVRIVAATNRNLKDEVDRGNFREDLFYRLNVIGITLPPLRERKDDIPILVNSILKKLVSHNVTPVIPPQTMQFLLNYHYPGNVRELENILERALVLGGEVILPEHLPDTVRNPSSENGPETSIVIDETLQLPIDLDKLLATVERRYLENALLETKGAKKRAAGLLGMNFRSFRYRLQKFGIEAED